MVGHWKTHTKAWLGMDSSVGVVALVTAHAILLGGAEIVLADVGMIVGQFGETGAAPLIDDADVPASDVFLAATAEVRELADRSSRQRSRRLSSHDVWCWMLSCGGGNLGNFGKLQVERRG